MANLFIIIVTENHHVLPICGCIVHRDGGRSKNLGQGTIAIDCLFVVIFVLFL